MAIVTNATDNAYPIPANAGLTIRELFAAMAMQGAIASGNLSFNEVNTGMIAAYAVKSADALINELNKPVETAEIDRDTQETIFGHSGEFEAMY